MFLRKDLGWHVNPALKSMLSDKHAGFGSTCERWRAGEKMKWCFVVFDSNCSDRREYVVDPTILDNVTRINQISQFVSNIPCMVEEFDAATRWCHILRFSFLFLISLLGLGTMPMGPIIYLFLRFRCGDLVHLQPQFDVEFSDDDTSDDFGVLDPCESKRGTIRGSCSIEKSSHKSDGIMESTGVEFVALHKHRGRSSSPSGGRSRSPSRGESISPSTGCLNKSPEVELVTLQKPIRSLS